MQAITLDEFLQAGEDLPNLPEINTDCPPPVQLGLPMKMLRTDNKSQVIYKGRPLGLEKDE